MSANNSPVASSSNALGLAFKIEAIIVLLAGAGIGLIALAGPLGVWLGLWNFGRGFDLLRLVNSYADWIAGIALLVAVSIFAVSFVKPIKNSLQLSGMALIGCVCAALAFFVPESFRPPEGTPPIHDITTDTLNPPMYVSIAPLRADASNSMEYGSGNNMTPQRLAELQQSAYPDIVPQRFDASVEQVFEQVFPRFSLSRGVRCRTQSRLSAVLRAISRRARHRPRCGSQLNSGRVVLDGCAEQREGVARHGRERCAGVEHEQQLLAEVRAVDVRRNDDRVALALIVLPSARGCHLFSPIRQSGSPTLHISTATERPYWPFGASQVSPGRKDKTSSESPGQTTASRMARYSPGPTPSPPTPLRNVPEGL